jgi:hypothetical protein
MGDVTRTPMQQAMTPAAPISPDKSASANTNHHRPVTARRLVRMPSQKPSRLSMIVGSVNFQQMAK